MNKLILGVLFFCCVVNANTQEKRIYLLGGDIGAFYTKNKVIQGISDYTHFDIYSFDLENFRIQLTPNFFYFVSDRFLVGGGVEWLRNSINYNRAIIQKTTDDLFVFYPAARGYIYRGIFLQGQFDIGKSFGNIESLSFHGYDYSKEITSGIYGFSAVAGYSIEVGSNIFIDCANEIRDP
jgi:hypothetical protein